MLNLIYIFNGKETDSLDEKLKPKNIFDVLHYLLVIKIVVDEFYVNQLIKKH